MKNTPFVNNGSFYSFGYPITTQSRFVKRQSFKRLEFFKMINENMIVMEKFIGIMWWTLIQLRGMLLSL